jgi:phosphoserine phosphatase
MLHAAGLGVGFHPKPKVRDEIPTLIIHSDLTALLYLQGYTRKDIAAVG